MQVLIKCSLGGATPPPNTALYINTAQENKMINAKIIKDDTQQKHDESLMHEAYPNLSLEENSKAVKLLDDYDAAYIATVKDLSYYYALSTSNTIIDTVNSKKLGDFFVNCTEAIFDRGINQLWQFYDKSAKEHRNILNRWKEIFGSDKGMSNLLKYERRLASYRNNYTAHYGNGFGIDRTNITIDLPLEIIDLIIKHRHSFEESKLKRENSLYHTSHIKDEVSLSVAQVASTLGLNKAQHTQAYAEVKAFINSIVPQK